MFTDTHAHIFREYYDNIESVLEEARSKNINMIINNGCDQKTNEEVLSTVERYSMIYGAIGIHPEYADNYNESDINFIIDNINHSKIVAIGEIGLDYHYTKENKEKQIKLFERQLEIAEKYNLPVIIHSRDATEDTIKTLKKFKVKGTIHSFSGSYETAQIYLKMGFKLGINGVVTFKNSKLKEVIKQLSLKDIILETDSPYLTPEPYRGTQNNPSHILDIAKYIADIFSVSLDELSKITNNNVQNIYKKIA